MALTLYLMSPGGQGVSAQVVDYTAQMAALRLTSVAPGGFGQLVARLRLSPGKVRLPRPEFTILNARAVLMDGAFCAFTGEVNQAALTLDQAGEGVEITALGGATSLSDDPLDSSYAAQTATQIIQDQYTQRAAYLPLDSDLSAVQVPSTTFSPNFDGRTFEDVLHELCDLLGDYVWSVWDHPTHRDGLGFPTWQLQVHARNTTTLANIATLADVLGWRVAPSGVRAYNGVTIRYTDPANGPGAVSVQDARLNADRSQGQAPFRFRRFRRDMGGRPLTAAQATSLANQYLSVFQNVANVITVRLGNVRDARGRVIPLWRVRADQTIAIPELLPRAATFPALANWQPGINLFYIRQAIYEQKAGESPALTLQLDQIADFAAADLTRLRYEEQVRQRAKRQPPATHPAGLLLKGHWSVHWGAASLAGDVWGSSVQFASVLSQPPTSLAFTAQSSSNVATGPTAANLTNWGGHVSVTTAANGGGYWIGTYTTVGN